ncbi:MAG: signal recognition particle receptor subunit alpha, partial [Verrucomicrobiota bacterium]
MGLFKNLIDRFRSSDVDWDDLEETLVTGDLGIRLTTELVDRLQARKEKFDAEQLANACREEIASILGEATYEVPPQPESGLPTVILVAGVNGVGKTTSIAKLAHFLRQKDKKS